MNLKNDIKPMPVVKWAGGKRQLIPIIREMIPKDYKRYYEPFFGGGALFFELQPRKAVINDFNPFLINVYKQIKANAEQLCEMLADFELLYNSKETDTERTEYYYSLRESFNHCITTNELSVYSAALFIFLNKAGFNGLYRVNKSGRYNVPPAHRDEIHCYQQTNVLSVSKCLKGTKILTGDFENSCKDAKKDDFVFFDSPYYDTFDTYQAGGFTEDDHKRLFELFDSLSKKGVYCMLTNNDCDFIKNLYHDYSIKPIPVINCDGKNRTGKEVIITNY